jgi:hypothetical protein
MAFQLFTRKKSLRSAPPSLIITPTPYTHSSLWAGDIGAIKVHYDAHCEVLDGELTLDEANLYQLPRRLSSDNEAKDLDADDLRIGGGILPDHVPNFWREVDGGTLRERVIRLVLNLRVLAIHEKGGFETGGSGLPVQVDISVCDLGYALLENVG